MKIYPFSDQETRLWSGGTTTELLIYPQDASYAARDFDFRISTATVEVEESDFTDLSGFQRYLLVLEGELLINHARHYEKQLKQLESDAFDGSWRTRSKGKVRDFNVIFRPDYAASVRVHNPDKRMSLSKQAAHHFLFLLDSLSVNGQMYSRYDLLELTENSPVQLNGKGSVLEILIDGKH